MNNCHLHIYAWRVEHWRMKTMLWCSQRDVHVSLMIPRPLTLLYHHAWNQISKAFGCCDHRPTLTLNSFFAVICGGMPAADGRWWGREALVVDYRCVFHSQTWCSGLAASHSDVSSLLSLLCRYDLDCKSDNLSKHVSVSFTSAIQQSVKHSRRHYAAQCLLSPYNGSVIWIGMSKAKKSPDGNKSNCDGF